MQKLISKIKSKFYYSSLSAFCQLLTRIFFLYPYFHLIKKTKIIIEDGVEIDAKKNYLLVSNHRSYNDPPLLGHALGLPVAFIAKKELFSNLFLKLFMLATSTIAVDRDKTDSSTFKEAKKALKSRGLFFPWSVGIFIEGTRSKDETKLGKPNKGPIFLARLAKAAIVPMGISYRGEKEIIVRVGKPYEIDYKGDLDDQAWTCLEKISHLCDYDLPLRS